MEAVKAALSHLRSARGSSAPPASGQRIKLGYLSADWGFEHPMSDLSQGNAVGARVYARQLEYIALL